MLDPRTVRRMSLVGFTWWLLLAAACSAPGTAGSNGGTSAAAEGGAPPAARSAADGREATAPTAIDTAWVCPDEPLEPRFEPTLFVAGDGSDDHDGRDPERPLRTLAAAADRVAPGDVVWVGGGVYASDVEISVAGSDDRPIVFESRPGECAILDGSLADAGDRVTFDGASHVVFRNFVVRNSGAEGIYLIDSDDNLLANLRVHDNYYSGITSIRGDRNLFRYVIAHDNVDADGGDADGISISSGDGNVIEYCVAFDNSDDGVDTWRSTNTTVERCISFGNGLQGGDGNGFKAGGGRQRVDTVVRYSIAFGNRSNGFDYNTGGHVTFEHNTAFGNGAYGFVATGAVVRNNLSLGNGSGDWYGEARGGDRASNSWEIGLGARDLVSTRDADADFLRLRDDGRAVDAGIGPAASVAAEAPDLGALERGETIASAFGIDLAALIDP